MQLLVLILWLPKAVNANAACCWLVLCVLISVTGVGLGYCSRSTHFDSSNKSSPLGPARKLIGG